MTTLDASARTWTDVSLAGDTSYTSTLEARDAAGNATRSPATTVKTLDINSNAVTASTPPTPTGAWTWPASIRP